MTRPTLSIVIPFFDEEENVGPVLEDVRRHQPDAEIIGIDDHSSDATFARLQATPDIVVLRLPRHLGQSAALYAGLRRARGELCALLDGDGQSSAADIKLLLAHIADHDLVIGRRIARDDVPSRILASRVANAVRRWLTGDGVHDTGGTPKLMRRTCIEDLIPFDGFHRFIPALLAQKGRRILEVPVAHRPRLHGASKYDNLGRAWRGLQDLLGVRWLARRRIDLRELEMSIDDPRRASAETAAESELDTGRGGLGPPAAGEADDARQ